MGHDTISSSISEVGHPNWRQRAFNVYMGMIGYLAVCLHLQEYESRYDDPDWLIVLYTVQCTAYLLLVVVAVFSRWDCLSLG